MKKYQIIYADPPWAEYGGGQIKRGADRHYPLMKTEEICALKIPADKNAHLYLWVTNNKLEDGLRVVRAWGFEYKTCITWMKDRFGLGQYYRGITEHCLFAVRGMLPYKTVDGKRAQGTTSFIAPRTEHSAKPEKMRELINLVSYVAGYNRLEIFARKKIEGWDVLGNEIDGEDIKTVLVESREDKIARMIEDL